VHFHVQYYSGFLWELKIQIQKEGRQKVLQSGLAHQNPDCKDPTQSGNRSLLKKKAANERWLL
jgi:hypothetical protein